MVRGRCAVYTPIDYQDIKICGKRNDSVVLEEGLIRKSVIVYFEAFKLLTKPLPDLLSRRNRFVSISSDCCIFVILQ